MFKVVLAALALSVVACAHASENKQAERGSVYEPMAIFAPLDGKALRGEGIGPDGKPIVDIAQWKLILGGRAFQSTHRLEGGDYGGRTIFFYDEGAEKYVFHYFTTAGFHTTGEVTPTDNGFTAVEKVLGHPKFIEVRSELVFGEEEIRVISSHVDKDGNETQGDGFIYREIDGANILLFDEADALFGNK